MDGTTAAMVSNQRIKCACRHQHLQHTHACNRPCLHASRARENEEQLSKANKLLHSLQLEKKQLEVRSGGREEG